MVTCRLLHFIHHKYNKEHSMSPFAGLAFHPLDGIIQAGLLFVHRGFAVQSTVIQTLLWQGCTVNVVIYKSTPLS